MVWEELETLLITSDVGIETSSMIIRNLRKQNFKDSLSLKKGLIDEVTKLLSPYSQSMDFSRSKPFVIMVVGVNGVGKTTTIAKLAKYFLDKNQKIL